MLKNQLGLSLLEVGLALIILSLVCAIASGYRYFDVIDGYFLRRTMLDIEHATVNYISTNKRVNEILSAGGVVEIPFSDLDVSLGSEWMGGGVIAKKKKNFINTMVYMNNVNYLDNEKIIQFLHGIGDNAGMISGDKIRSINGVWETPISFWGEFAEVLKNKRIFYFFSFASNYPENVTGVGFTVSSLLHESKTTKWIPFLKNDYIYLSWDKKGGDYYQVTIEKKGEIITRRINDNFFKVTAEDIYEPRVSANEEIFTFGIQNCSMLLGCSVKKNIKISMIKPTVQQYIDNTIRDIRYRLVQKNYNWEYGSLQPTDGNKSGDVMLLLPVEFLFEMKKNNKDIESSNLLYPFSILLSVNGKRWNGIVSAEYFIFLYGTLVKKLSKTSFGDLRFFSFFKDNAIILDNSGLSFDITVSISGLGEQIYSGKCINTLETPYYTVSEVFAF